MVCKFNRHLGSKLRIRRLALGVTQTIVAQAYKHSEFGEIDIKSLPIVKKIAGPHLEKSWSEIPHVTQHDEADITEMEQFR